MRKWIYLLIIAALIFAGFIPVSQTTTFRIDASLFNIYRQITSPSNWRKWNPHLKSTALKVDSTQSHFTITAPAVTYAVTNANLGEFIIAKKKQNRSITYTYLLQPNEKAGNTAVTCSATTSIWQYLWSSFSDNDISDTPLGQLKHYMEDNSLYYGFNISKQLTAEKMIAVVRGSFSKQNNYAGSAELLKKLQACIIQNQLTTAGALQVQYINTGADSVQMMAGFPVKNEVKGAAGVEYMKMQKGKVLVGYFTGVYATKNKIYDAMRTYMSDHYMRPMIQPFERFDNNRLPAGDSKIVHMQLVIPYM